MFVYTRELRAGPALLLTASFCLVLSACLPTPTDLELHSARALYLELCLEAVDRQDFEMARTQIAGAQIPQSDDAGDKAIVESLEREDADGARAALLIALDREIVFVSGKLVGRQGLNKDETWALGVLKRIDRYRDQHPPPASPSSAAGTAALKEAIKFFP